MGRGYCAQCAHDEVEEGVMKHTETVEGNASSEAALTLLARLRDEARERLDAHKILDDAYFHVWRTSWGVGLNTEFRSTKGAKMSELEELKKRVLEELELARAELARASAFEEAVTAAAVGEVDSKQA